MQSKFKITDNTHGRFARCIQGLGRSKTARIGEVVVVSLRKVKPWGPIKPTTKVKLKRGDVCRALVTNCRMPFKRNTCVRVRLGRNSIVLLQKKGVPMGSRTKGPVSRDLRYTKHIKVAMQAPLLF